MKKLVVILVPVVVVCAVALLVMLFAMPNGEGQPIGAPEGKLMSIEAYVSQHISELSPKKEVLGGKFYVTSVEASDGEGVVSYEDGHVAYTADFTYTASDREGIRITSFTVRE